MGPPAGDAIGIDFTLGERSIIGAIGEVDLLAVVDGLGEVEQQGGSGAGKLTRCT